MQKFVIRELEKVDLENSLKVLTQCLEDADDPCFAFVGVGKTAHTAARLASSYISMGVKAKFLHAGDSLHGDVGALEIGDVICLLSYSGETAEILGLVEHLKTRGHRRLIGVTSKPNSSLEFAGAKCIYLNCSNGLPSVPSVPSVSLYAIQMVFDVFLAEYCLRSGRSLVDFSLNHPGGGIGKRFATTIKIFARPVSEITVPFSSDLAAMSLNMDVCKTNLAYVVLGEVFAGCLSSGDVRRLSTAQKQHITLENLNQTPFCLSETETVHTALAKMKDVGIKTAFVTDHSLKIWGYVSFEDLIN